MPRVVGLAQFLIWLNNKLSLGWGLLHCYSMWSIFVLMTVQ